MKTVLPGLQDHLDGEATTLCRCWRVTRADGAVLGFTDHDRDLSFDGTNFEASTGVSASELQQAAGFNADTQEIAGAFSSLAIEETDLRAGKFDGARAELWLVNWQATENRLLERVFKLGETVCEDGAYRVELRSLSADMDQPQGRRFSRSCDADLGDARCGVELTGPVYSSVSTVSAVRAELVLLASGLDAFTNGWFTGGRITFQTGANVGLSMEVARHQNSDQITSLQLWKSMPDDVVAGDQFLVRAGCDKRFQTCRDKFANTVNFRGFPHMPGNDFSFGYATPNAIMDGGPLVE